MNELFQPLTAEILIPLNGLFLVFISVKIWKLAKASSLKNSTVLQVVQVLGAALFFHIFALVAAIYCVISPLATLFSLNARNGTGIVLLAVYFYCAIFYLWRLPKYLIQQNYPARLMVAHLLATWFLWASLWLAASGLIILNDRPLNWRVEISGVMLLAVLLVGIVLHYNPRWIPKRFVKQT